MTHQSDCLEAQGLEFDLKKKKSQAQLPLVISALGW